MKTNDLRYSTAKIGVNCYNEKADIIVKIRLNDECKNGHEDFSITADIYKTGKRSDINFLAGGCCHDEILKFFPEFKIFVDLHLSDWNGFPMYCIENGFYHLTDGFNNIKPKDPGFDAEFCNYYRISLDKYEILKKSENKVEYGILLKELGILKDWTKQANKAIKELEKLTGNEFESKATRTQYNEPPKEQIADFKQKKESGYFTDEQKAIRNKEAKEAKRVKRFKNITERYDKTIREAEHDKKIILWIARKLDKLSIKKQFTLDCHFDNLIYYTHSKIICFNWQDFSFSPKMSEQEFNMFCDSITEGEFNNILPQGISFELKGVKQYSL
jgi:hypothetical protein